MKNINKKGISKPIEKITLPEGVSEDEFFEKNDQKIEPEKRPDFNLDRDYYTGKKAPEEFPEYVKKTEETGEGEEGEKSEPEIIQKPENMIVQKKVVAPNKETNKLP